MCKIVGFANLDIDFTIEQDKWNNILSAMKNSINNIDPYDKCELWLVHTVLANINPLNTDSKVRGQPIIRYKSGNSYAIVYSGSLRNKGRLRDNLQRMGYLLKTSTDSEVILTGYMAFDKEIFNELKGEFAFAIWDDNNKALLLFRDKYGIKPLFFSLYDGTLVFSSDSKAVISCPAIMSLSYMENNCEIIDSHYDTSHQIAIGHKLMEVKSKHYVIFDKDGLHEKLI